MKHVPPADAVRELATAIFTKLQYPMEMVKKIDEKTLELERLIGHAEAYEFYLQAKTDARDQPGDRYDYLLKRIERKIELTNKII